MPYLHLISICNQRSSLFRNETFLLILKWPSKMLQYILCTYIPSFSTVSYFAIKLVSVFQKCGKFESNSFSLVLANFIKHKHFFLKSECTTYVWLHMMLYFTWWEMNSTNIKVTYVTYGFVVLNYYSQRLGRRAIPIYSIVNR